MMRSLYSGVSGLRNHQTRMDVIGNNIANVNTTGYKTSRTIFQDIYSQTVRSASAGTATLGGTNPSQIGLGVRLATIDTIFTSGATQITDNPSDLAIEGDGFFIVDTNGTDTGGLKYTRAGNFYIDNSGNLVTSDGYFVMGYKLAQGKTSTAQVQSKDSKGELVWETETLPVKLFEADGTTPIWKTSADGKSYIVDDGNGGTEEILITAYDPLVHGARIQETKDVEHYKINGGPSVPVDGYTNASGNRIPVMEDELQIDYTLLAVPANPTQADLSFINLADYVNISFDESGTIWGVDKVGQKVAVAQVAMAMFTNNSGLEKVGGSLYDATASSGNAVYTLSGSKGAGKINPGGLEMSNVDLAAEFTDMIITQRGFQANSRIITTSDSMLEELVNLKR